MREELARVNSRLNYIEDNVPGLRYRSDMKIIEKHRNRGDLIGG